MDFYKFLTSFSQVETVTGLLAFIVAGILGYLAYQSAGRMKRIGSIIEKADTQSKADLAASLAGVLPAYRIPELTRQHGFEVVKLQLEQRAREFKSRIGLLRLGVLLLFLLIGGLIVKNYLDFTQTNGAGSPVIKGDNARIEYNSGASGEDSTSGKDSTK